MEKVGIKETLDVFEFAEHLSVKMVMALKDGIGLDDLRLLLDAELYKKGKDAVENIKLVDDEIKDLDLNEGEELASRGVLMAKNIAAALKG